MKRNLILGMVLMGALAISSCSTTQLATNKLGKDDDVYFSDAKAGDAPVYVASQQPQQNRYNNYNDDDYYYYDSYSSRINRFGYFSPFGYYNDIYAGYSPYYGGGARFGLGIGLGWGYGGYYGYNNPFYYGGYDPFFYGGGFGYNPYWGYNSWGIGYGWGYGGNVWGVYSSYGGVANNGTPRPYRGSGAPGSSMTNRSAGNIGYNGNYPINNAYPGRPQVAGSTAGGRQAVNSYGDQQRNGGARPTRGDAPVYNPPVQSVPQSSGSRGGSVGSSSSSGGGGGGARPVRP